MRVLFMILFVLLALPAQANFLNRKAEGWHFYESIQEPKESLEKKETPTRKEVIPTPKPEVPPPPEDNDPLSRLETFKKTVEGLKATAVMDPSYENVKAYMEIQKNLMERSTRFAEKWLEVVYTSPSLDYTIHHPTSQSARHVYLDEEQKAMNDEIRGLSQRYGLFFFYRSDCPYCREFAPIVKAFSLKHRWEVLAISLDGTILPEFPDSRVDNGASSTLGIQSVPALLAVEPKSGKVIPLSRGMSTHDQIEDRIRVLIMKRNHL